MNILRDLLGEPTAQKRAGLAFSVATVLPYLLSVLLSVVFVSVGLLYEGVEDENWYLYVTYLLPQVSFATVAFIVMRWSKMTVKELVQSPKPIDFALAIGLQFGLFSLGTVNEWFVAFLKGLGLSASAVKLPSLDGFGLYAVLFCVAVLPAIFEETIFRGILLKGLRDFPWWAAALISGGMFALFHQNPAQTIYQFFCGAAFALIAIRAGSILPTVVAHFANNAFIILAERFGWSINVLPILLSSAICLAVVLGYLVYGLVKGAKTAEKQPTAIGKPKTPAKTSSKKEFFLYASVGLFLCAIVWVAGLFGV